MLSQGRKMVGLQVWVSSRIKRNHFFPVKNLSRSNASSDDSNSAELTKLEDEFKAILADGGLADKKEERSIFCNHAIELSRIKAYGFDYDYTLASYKPELTDVIFEEALKNLVCHYNYPEELLKMEEKLEPKDVIRGLHFDTREGYLLKINAYQNILRYTVHRGLEQVEDVEEKYSGLHVKNDDILASKDNFGRPRFRQMVDIYSNSEAAVLGTVVEFFRKSKLEIDNGLLFRDCQDAVKDVHVSGKLGSIVEKNFDYYLNRNDELRRYLERLKKNKKMTFILTNSDYNIMNKGMEHMLGKDWMTLFDVVVTNSKKPSFYQQNYRPFRLLDKDGKKTWGKVEKFEKGNIYVEGNVEVFQKLIGFRGMEVIYFGDHVLNDLVGPVINPGWRTGAIIHELESEIAKMNMESFRKKRYLLSRLHPFIQRVQLFLGAAENRAAKEYNDAKNLLKEAEDKRAEARNEMKNAINPKFGSVFRSFGSSSFFNRRLIRFADIYSSRVENLIHYPLDVTLYPR